MKRIYVFAILSCIMTLILFCSCNKNNTGQPADEPTRAETSAETSRAPEQTENLQTTAEENVTSDENTVFDAKNCTHPSHNTDGVCEICGKKVKHTMENLKCTICGYKINYATKKVPSDYTGKCKQNGRVEKIVYDSVNYSNNQPKTNTVFIYLPYGYDDYPDMEYNVLYLLHGSGENAAYWLAQLSYAGGYTEKTLKVLDNLHCLGVCEPTIVVTPTENLNGTEYFYKELEEIIIPLIETRYRTKAGVYGLDPSEVKDSDIINSRESRAFAGLSLGSIITWDIMGRELDKFAYYGFYSGGTRGDARKANLRKTLKDESNQIYPIKYAYHSCGTNDSMYADHLADYQYFVKISDMLTDGQNTYFLSKERLQHNYSSWIIDLYNSLAFDFFKH